VRFHRGTREKAAGSMKKSVQTERREEGLVAVSSLGQVEKGGVHGLVPGGYAARKGEKGGLNR